MNEIVDKIYNLKQKFKVYEQSVVREKKTNY